MWTLAPVAPAATWGTREKEVCTGLCSGLALPESIPSQGNRPADGRPGLRARWTVGTSGGSG